ncbi:MAG TPA: type II toxin-antitoxin system VapC family toxin [Longimicrobiales bacterium]|nr:type II toxin-antitoxin system VapC family toxin [Longimicrobiales bacterium]
MLVIDASAMVQVLLRGAGANAIEERLFSGESLHAPHLLDLEVAQVLRRYQLAGDLDDARGELALDLHRDFAIQRYPHHLFLSRVWQLRRNATAYDAVYLALAEALGATLLTRDRRLAGVPGCVAEVEVV